MSRSRIVTALGIPLACAALAACSSGSAAGTSTGASSGGSAAAKPTTLRVVNPALGDTFVDPASDEFELYVGNAEALLHPKAGGGQEPWLAESVEPVDPKTWRVTLRKGLTFQSGKPLTGAVLAKWFGYEVANGSDAGTRFKGATAKADGELGMLVTFPEARADFRGDAANYTLEVYDSEAVAAVGKDFNKLAGAGVFTGPYMLSTVTAQKWTYTANPKYWRGTPSLTTIEVQKASDPQAAVKAIQAGQADLLWFAPVKIQPTVVATKGLHFNPGDSAEVESLAFNLTKAPWSDPAVRKALALTIDSAAISTKGTFGVFPATKGWFPSSSPLAVDFMTTDLAQAKQVLDAAGWVAGPDGVRTKNGVRLEADLLSYTDDLNSLSIPLADGATAAGFKLTPKKLEGSAWREQYGNGGFALTMINDENFGINGDTGVICNYFGHRDNNSGINDPAIETECAKIQQSRDPKVVDPAIKAILEINARQYYRLPVVQRVSSWVTNDAWKSAKPDAFYMPTTWDMQAG